MKKFFTLKVLALTVSMLFIGTNNILAEDDKQIQVTIPATGHVAIRPERNFKGPEGLVVSNFYGSANATSPGLKFVNKELGAGVVIAHAANSSTGLILTGQPGTYTITYTDDAGTQNFTSANATPEVIYNMQGIRLSKLQRGLNIVNGRIVVIK